MVCRLYTAVSRTRMLKYFYFVVFVLLFSLHWFWSFFCFSFTCISFSLLAISFSKNKLELSWVEIEFINVAKFCCEMAAAKTVDMEFRGRRLVCEFFKWNCGPKADREMDDPTASRPGLKQIDGKMARDHIDLGHIKLSPRRPGSLKPVVDDGLGSARDRLDHPRCHGRPPTSPKIPKQWCSEDL